MLSTLQAASVLFLGWSLALLVAGDEYASTSSTSGGSAPAPGGYGSSGGDKDLADRLHPAHDEYGCKYMGEWGDCDPFKMIRIKEQKLVSGGASCTESKNITKPCSRDDFPPGTVWLLNEHKLCVQELQKLKTMIEDLHRYIDLIHQRGQSLFNAYNELRKRLMDIRREISIIGRRNHDAEQTIKRLKVEMEDWKTKSNQMTMELNQLKAQYKEAETKLKISKQTYEELTKEKDDLTSEQQRITTKYDKLVVDNRNLKSSLLDAERYKEEFREESEFVAMLKKKVKEVQLEIEKTREDLKQARLEGAKPKFNQKAPKFNKDTKVNLDMSMWITHNISREEQEAYVPEFKYVEPTTYGYGYGYEEPSTTTEYYEPPTTTYEEPTTPYEEPKYEAPKYEAPKYEEPKYEAPKYEAPKYEAPQETYEEPKTEAPKYEEPTTEPPKYEEPTTEEPKYEEPKPY